MRIKHMTAVTAAWGVSLFSAQAIPMVLPGFDLLETRDGTQFLGFDFEGVPLPDFDFGSGPEDVGDTDTIVQRKDPANSSGAHPDTAPTIDIEMVALQLRSVDPINLGAGLDIHYVTLAGPSLGTMDITFDTSNSGTFDSTLDLNFDIRIGALNGPIILTQTLSLSSTNTPWSRIPPAGAVQIPGVNHELNGTDPSGDFWPGLIVETHPGTAVHVASSTVPDHTHAFSLFALSLLGLGAARRKWARR